MAAKGINKNQKPMQEEHASLCRVCALQKKDVIDIFSPESEDEFIADKINCCLPITVTRDDVLPLQVCLHCMLWLGMVYELNEKCREADTYLRSLFVTSRVETPVDNEDGYDTSSSYIISQDLPHTTPDHSRCSSEERQCNNLIAETEKLEEPKEISKAPRALKNPPLLCRECSKEPQSWHAYCFHQSTSHNQYSISCKHCCVFFSSNLRLKEHQEEIHPKDRKIVKRKKTIKKHHKCLRCNQIFPLEEKCEYKKHLKQHSKDSLEKKLKKSNIKCNFCDQFFTTKTSKYSHMEKEHADSWSFTCNECGKNFKKRHALVAHINLHINVGYFLCEKCGRSFNNKTALRSHKNTHTIKKVECSICTKLVSSDRMSRHMRAHAKIRSFKCPQCPMSFYDKSHLRQHVLNHIKDPKSCEICGCTFNRKSNLTYHIKKAHSNKETGNYICSMSTCKNEFPTASELILHCKEHKSRGEMLLNKSRNKTNSNLKASPVTFYCCYCNKYIKNLTIYTTHMKNHSKVDPSATFKLYCSFCDFVAYNSYNFTKHLCIHPDAYVYQCKLCDKKFVNYGKKMNHARYAHSSKNYQCHSCPKTFYQMYHMQEHIISAHAGVRPFQCPDCNKSFVSKRHLQTHSTIHTGEKNFVCRICSRRFRLKGDMQIHERKHTGEMTYNCNLCEYGCHKRKLLLQHLRDVHDMPNT